jgi:hypothetical protein
LPAFPEQVIGFHDAKTHRFLAVSHQGKTRRVLECSMRPSVVASDATVEREKKGKKRKHEEKKKKKKKKKNKNRWNTSSRGIQHISFVPSQPSTPRSPSPIILIFKICFPLPSF